MPACLRLNARHFENIPIYSIVAAKLLSMSGRVDTAATFDAPLNCYVLATGPAARAATAPSTAVAIRKPIRDDAGRLLPLHKPLKVCLMTADFPGLPNAGHTATAFTLLAAALGTDPSLRVSDPYGAMRALASPFTT